MKSLERILNTFEGKPVDRVPLYDYLFQKELFEKLIGVRPESYNIHQAIECAKILHHDMVACFVGNAEDFDMPVDENGEYTDEFGTVFAIREEVSWPVNAPVQFPVSDWDSYKCLKYPDPAAKGRTDELIEGLKKNNDELAISAGIEGPFTRIWMLMGPEELFILLHTEPDLIKTIFNDMTDYLIACAKHIEAASPHVFSIAEDLGASAGPFISLPMFREFVLPSLEKLVSSINIPVFFHSCGNINLYMDDLVDLGLKAIHPLQRTANMDLRKMKEKYGDRITLVGNVDSSRTLPYGSIEDVERETLECLEIGKPGGRYILASDHSLHDGIPIENIVHMFETGLKYGQY